MRKIACAAALLLLTGPALAQDPFAPPADKFAPPPLTPGKPKPRHHDWNGFYVGGQAGLSAGEAKSKWDTQNSTSPAFGAHAGYNYQFGRGLVLGGESDVSSK